MVVELILDLASDFLAVHLGHLLQALEHRRDDTLVVRVDDSADLEVVGILELALDARHEELSQLVSHRSARKSPERTGKIRTNGTTPFRFLSVSFVCSILLIWSFCKRTRHQRSSLLATQPKRTQASSSPLIAFWYCFCSIRSRKSFRSSSARKIARSNAANTPMICLPVALAPSAPHPRKKNAHAVLGQDPLDPLLQLAVQEPKDEVHRRTNVLELVLLRSEVARRTTTEVRLEKHVVGKRDRGVEGVDVQKVGDEVLLAENVLRDLLESSSESLARARQLRRVKQGRRNSLRCRCTCPIRPCPSDLGRGDYERASQPSESTVAESSASPSSSQSLRLGR